MAVASRALTRRLRSSLALLPAVVFGGCMATSPRDAHVSLPFADVAEVADDVAELGAGAVSELARGLAGIATAHEVAGLTAHTLNHRTLWSSLEDMIDGVGGVHRHEIGRSVEGRALYAVEFGRGPVRVLLWSQMHGDEPTATLALVDILRFVTSMPDDPLVTRLRDRLTVVMVPMLNPDGAQRGRRENAGGIDLNRDARRQATPEARALAAVHARLGPHFGFNLHDQSRRIADDGRVVAISLLAPPYAAKPSDLPTLQRAKQLVAVMRMAADSLVDGRVTRYEESYNAQAFGDAMQSWGTSTVLLETGDWEDDADKAYLRHVNFALLLTALDAIATRSFERAPLHQYETLPGTRPVNHR
jgi:hypothetical protein